MNSLVKSMDGLSRIWKFILALPLLDIVWAIYRLMRSISKGSVLGIILAVLLIFIGIPFLWLVDMITIILFNRVLWIH